MRQYTIITEELSDLVTFDRAIEWRDTLMKVDDILRMIIKHCDLAENVEARLSECRTLIHEVNRD